MYSGILLIVIFGLFSFACANQTSNNFQSCASDDYSFINSQKCTIFAVNITSCDQTNCAIDFETDLTIKIDFKIEELQSTFLNFNIAYEYLNETIITNYNGTCDITNVENGNEINSSCLINTKINKEELFFRDLNIKLILSNDVEDKCCFKTPIFFGPTLRHMGNYKNTTDDSDLNMIEKQNPTILTKTEEQHFPQLSPERRLPTLH